MYKIVLPIPTYDAGDGSIAIPCGLARDLLAQTRYEPGLRLICPRARTIDHVNDPTLVDLSCFPGLSFAFLPYNGSRRTWPRSYFAVRRMLEAEASDSDVWHTGCSLGLWDLTTVSYDCGLRCAPGLRIFCLDSDPSAMLRASGGMASYKSRLVRQSLIRRVRGADVTIVVGQGVKEGYQRYARKCVATEAVWLMEGDLADEEATRSKYKAGGPVRIAVPSRLTAWKGVDDAIRAIALLGDRIGPFTLDIIGDGEEKDALVRLVQDERVGDRVRFLPPIPYGEPFFQTLRGYHMVLAPTRGLEETRIVYDAAASGCILVHSRTKTLESALASLPRCWSHEPGRPDSLADAIAEAIGVRADWSDVALQGIRAMQGRTIDAMHRGRFEFLKSLRKASAARTGQEILAS